jgi:hypothetical protein
MMSARYLLSWLLTVAMSCSLLNAQQTSPSAQSAIVPRLVNFSGKATGSQGTIITGIAGATFAIYKGQYEGSPLWLETQKVQADAKGNYTAQLGATKPDGLPLDLFSSGEARWLGVTINGGQEQPRLLLLSVPYALKAADAETIGGLPPSAFVLAAPPPNYPASTSAPNPATANASPSPLTLGGGGTTDFVPLWTPNGTTLGNSVMLQSGTGTSAKIGINTTKPASTLDVSGAETVRGNLSLPATGTAGATSGKNSQPTTLTASAYNSSTKVAVSQNFRWQSEPAGNNTASPSGTLNLLFGSGSNTPTETGLNISSNGQIAFASGQTFPGAGTITGVTTPAGNGLTGGGSSGNVTLGVDSTQVPFLGMPNIFSGNQTVNGSLTASALSGNGASLTNLNASNLTAGTVPVSGLSGTYNINISGNAATASSVSGTTGAFSGSNSTQIVSVTQSGSGSALAATAAPGGGGAGVYGSGYWGLYGTGITGVYGTGGSSGLTGVSSTPNGYGVIAYGGSSGGYGVYGNGGAYGLYGSSSGGSGTGVYGYNSSNASYGQLGTSVSGNATGVYGYGSTNGVYGYGSTYGIYGNGFWGLYGTGSDTGVYGSGSTYGVSGYNSSNASFGALATTVAGGTGVYGTGSAYGVYATGTYGVVANGSSAGDGVVASGANGIVASGFNYAVYAEGNFAASGTKSAVVPLPDDRVVSLYAVESPENWFEDFGGGQLRDGVAEVALDPTFALTVNAEAGYRVFLTPQGDCEGVYVANKTATGFQVRELRGGKSNAGFDYRIVAKRKGLESLRMEEVSAEHETAEAIRQQIADRPSHAPRLQLPKVPEPPAAPKAPAMPGKLDAPLAPALIVPPAIVGRPPAVPKPPTLPHN